MFLTMNKPRHYDSLKPRTLLGYAPCMAFTFAVFANSLHRKSDPHMPCTPTGFGLSILKHFFLSPMSRGVKKLEQSFLHPISFYLFFKFPSDLHYSCICIVGSVCIKDCKDAFVLKLDA